MLEIVLQISLPQLQAASRDSPHLLFPLNLERETWGQMSRFLAWMFFKSPGLIVRRR